MRSDREKLEALLRGWGIRWEVKSSWEKQDGKLTEHPGRAVVVSGDLGNPRVEGYSAFYVKFEFTGDGTFLKMGLWE